MNKLFLFSGICLLCFVAHAELSRSEVDEYLDKHPEVIEEYVLKKQKAMMQKMSELVAKRNQEGRGPLNKNSGMMDPHIRENIINNAQKTIAALDALTTKSGNTKSEQIKTQRTSEYVLGNPKGTFVIKAIYDYQCGWCRKSNVSLQKILQSEKGKNIKVILLPNPIFGATSELMAKYVLASAKQGKLAQMHDAVFTKEARSEVELISVAGELELDVEQLREDAHSREIEDIIKANQKMANDLKLPGVPAFIINGKIHQGAILDEKAEEILKMQQ